MNLKDTFYLAARGLDSVTPQTISNCWNEGVREAFPETQDEDPSNDFEGFTTDEIAKAEK